MRTSVAGLWPMVVGVVVALTSPVLAQIGFASHDDKVNKFRFKPAPMWVRADDNVIDDWNLIQDKQNPYRTWEVTTVWSRGAKDKLDFPAIRAEVISNAFGTMTLAQIEKAFGAPTKADRATVLAQPVAKMHTSLADGEMLLDRQRKRIVERMVLTGNDGKPMQRYSIGFLGKECSVHMVLACPPERLEQCLPEFQQFVDSFKFDAGAEYTEPPSPNTLLDDWRAHRSKAQIDAAAAEDRAAMQAARRSAGPSSGSRGVRFYGIGGIGVGAGGLGLLIRWWLLRDT